MTTISVKGLAELKKKLDELPLKLRLNVMRSALRSGANVVKKEAQNQLDANGNVQTGLLSKGIKVSTSSKREQAKASIKVKGKHAYIAHWIEYTGAAPHIIRPKNAKALAVAGKLVRTIQHPGFQPKPFLRPALDIAAAAAVVAVGEAIKERLSTKHGIDTSEIEVSEE